MKKNDSIFFICLLLRYSRLLCVYAQDHKYNATEACQAIYRAFCRLGGRASVLVIDQDAVFVSSETYGEVIKTRVFEDFCTEQELKLWVCQKADPESKGPIENSVGFVKKNFFSARKISCIDDVWRSLPGWLQRKNSRIHQATYRVPNEVFESYEKEALKPVLPSVYETSPNSFISYAVGSQPYVLYKSCHYSVPQKYAYAKVFFKVVADRMYIYDEDHKYLCVHNLSERRGSYNQLPEHKRDLDGDWIRISEEMRNKWNCYDFQHFINGVKKENGRNTARQLKAISKYLDAMRQDKTFVADVLHECCENYRYTYSQFKTVFDLHMAKLHTSSNTAAILAAETVEYKGLDTYEKAFNARIVRNGVRA